MKWTERKLGKWYAAGIHGRWERDEFGNEWTCGFAILREEDYIDCRTRFYLFEDDGEGNGNAIASFNSLGEAQEYAANLDARLSA